MRRHAPAPDTPGPQASGTTAGRAASGTPATGRLRDTVPTLTEATTAAVTSVDVTPAATAAGARGIARAAVHRPGRAARLLSGPVGAMTDIVRVGKVRQDGPPQLQDVHLALLLVEHFPIGREQDREGHAGLPLRIEGRLHGVSILGSEQQVAAARVLLLERLQYTRPLVGHVRRDGHHVEVAAAEHAVGGLDVRELAHAGP